MQGLDKVYVFNKKILIKQNIESVLSKIYSTVIIYFFKYHNIGKFTNLSFSSKEKKFKRV